MGSTLVVNPGSTSRKYAWYRDDTRVFSVAIETTPSGLAAFVTNQAGQTIQHEDAPTSLLRAFSFASELANSAGVVTSNDAAALRVVLRVVAPGEEFAQHQYHTEAVAAALKKAAPLVPLHIPIVQAELAAIQEALPEALILLASDSAFHSEQDARVRATGMAAADAKRAGWRRFGYHGLSVASVLRQLQEREGVVPTRTIVCHIGGGVSVTAVKEGQSVATSMGLTPASGVAMGTRGGDMTADELAALLTVGTVTTETMWKYLYTETGWYGKTGQADLRTVLDAASDPHSAAAATVATFIYQVQSYIAQYTVLLGGVDRIVLTGTAALRNSYIRQQLLSELTVLGVQLDQEVNESLRGNGVISTTDSPVLVEVLKNDEFGEMAKIAHEH